MQGGSMAAGIGLAGVAVAAGIAFAGFQIAGSRAPERAVTVKGLSERIVEADAATCENGGEKVGHGSGGMSPLRAAQ